MSIDWSKPIELVNGTPAHLEAVVEGQRRVRVNGVKLFCFDGQGRLYADGFLGPLIRNVAPPAEAVKLSDGSEIRGGWIYVTANPLRNAQAVPLSMLRASRLSTGDFEFRFGGKSQTVFEMGDVLHVGIADARLIAVAIGLDIDAMIGGGE